MIFVPRFRRLLIALGSLLTAAWAGAETLTFSALKEDESIVIGYVSTGCFHHWERMYVFRGSSRLGMDVYGPSEGKKGTAGDSLALDRFLVRASLTPDELAGLDSYLTYLRSVTDGGCTTVENFTIEYYRGAVKIGEEMLGDATCSLHIYWVDGKIAYDETNRPPGISTKLYKTVVTPRLLERRAEETTK
jgi:hypothetical protein